MSAQFPTTPPREPVELFSVRCDPGTPWPVPLAGPWTVDSFDDEVIVVGEPSRDVPSAELPIEFFLREAVDLDVDDPAVLAGLITSYGLVTPLAVSASGRLALLGEVPPGLMMREAANDDDDPLGAAYTVRTETVRYHLKVLRALSKVWVAKVADAAEAEVMEAWTSEGFNDPTRGGKTDGRFNAWNWWQLHLNAAISPVQPRVIVEGASMTRPTPLFTLVALQLWNSVVEQDDYRRCKNERCSRWFSRQRGGATSAQYRTRGVVFCTPVCARAQSVREFRRRQRATANDQREA